MANPFPFASGDVLTAAELNDIGAWTAYTPTLTNFTASSIDAEYAEVNNIMFVRVFITVSGVTGIPVFSLPKNYNAQMTSTAVYGDSGALSYTGNFLGWSANQVFCAVGNASGTYTYWSFCNTTVPFTWASGDTIQGMLVAKV